MFISLYSCPLLSEIGNRCNFKQTAIDVAKLTKVVSLFTLVLFKSILPFFDISVDPDQLASDHFDSKYILTTGMLQITSIKTGGVPYINSTQHGKVKSPNHSCSK